MPSKELDNLVETGLPKAEPGEQEEFDGLVASGEARLADAKVRGLSQEGRFTLAYDAAHAFSLAALRWHGYRPDQKRFVVFQALPHTLGLGPEVWRVLDKGHQLRNLAEYEGRFEVDERLLSDLLAAVEVVAGAVRRLGAVRTAKPSTK
jgi:hypothetical protein